MSERRITIREVNYKDKNHFAKTYILTPEHTGYEVSTIYLVEDSTRLETLVFKYPRVDIEDYREVEDLYLAPFNITNIEDAETAQRNHIDAVETAAELLRVRGY